MNIDAQAHYHWCYPQEGRFLITVRDRDLNDFHPDFVNAYVEFDRSLGIILKEFYNSIIIVCSDHGWSFGGHEHAEGHPGVIMIWGRGVKSGVLLKNVTVYDIVPTILWLYNVPVAEDMIGNVLTEAFTKHKEIIFCPTYGVINRQGTGYLKSKEKIKKELKRLKSLGYIK